MCGVPATVMQDNYSKTPKTSTTSAGQSPKTHQTCFTRSSIY